MDGGAADVHGAGPVSVALLLNSDGVLAGRDGERGGLVPGKGSINLGVAPVQTTYLLSEGETKTGVLPARQFVYLVGDGWQSDGSPSAAVLELMSCANFNGTSSPSRSIYRPFASGPLLAVVAEVVGEAATAAADVDAGDC